MRRTHRESEDLPPTGHDVTFLGEVRAESRVVMRSMCSVCCVGLLFDLMNIPLPHALWIGGDCVCALRGRAMSCFQQPSRGVATRVSLIVELLVVVAIIGLLVALLLPARCAGGSRGCASVCSAKIICIRLELPCITIMLRSASCRPGGIEVRPETPRGKQIAWSAMVLPFLEQIRRLFENQFQLCV